MMDTSWIQAVNDSFQQNKAWTVDWYYYRKAEDRSNDAIQRRVADLKAAGLNPMLAFGGMGGQPASVPQAPSTRASGGAQFVPTSAVSAHAELMKGQTGLLQAQARNLDADTQLKNASAAQAVGHTKVLEAELPRIAGEIERMRTESDLNRVKAEIEGLERDKLRQILPALIREAQARMQKAEFGTPTMEEANRQQRSLWNWLHDLGSKLGILVYERGPGAAGRSWREREFFKGEEK